MRITAPGFPHFEVFSKIMTVIRPYTDDPVDLMALTLTLGCYAARWIKMRRGGTLTQEEWTDHCLLAFNGSNDRAAKEVLGERS